MPTVTDTRSSGTAAVVNALVRSLAVAVDDAEVDSSGVGGPLRPATPGEVLGEPESTTATAVPGSGFLGEFRSGDMFGATPGGTAQVALSSESSEGTGDKLGVAEDGATAGIAPLRGPPAFSPAWVPTAALLVSEAAGIEAQLPTLLDGTSSSDVAIGMVAGGTVDDIVGLKSKGKK